MWPYGLGRFGKAELTVIPNRANGCVWTRATMHVHTKFLRLRKPVSVGDAFVAMFPPLEAIQEFKVQTGNYTAEYGGNAGANINVQLNSGTNSLE